tara:strand:- start:189 stop:1097 length:909 start_codon:yes stop_codon:yes gene_type:complete
MSLSNDAVRLLETFPKGADFTPIKVDALNPINGERIHGKHHVLHPVTKQWLHFCGSKDRRSNFFEPVEAAVRSLDQSGAVDLAGVKARYHLAPDFTTLKTEFLLADFRGKKDYDLALGDPVGATATIYDSHNATCRRHAKVGMIRLLCANGMIGFDGQTQTARRKHTTYDDATIFGEQLADLVQGLDLQVAQLQIFQKATVSRKSSMDFIEAQLKPSKADFEKIQAIYDYYGDMGSTGYRLYNTLTHMVSHGLTTNVHSTYINWKSGTKNGVNAFLSSMNYEAKISKIINGLEFKKLVEVEV